jgi:hypothetical protein
MKTRMSLSLIAARGRGLRLIIKQEVVAFESILQELGTVAGHHANDDYAL